jgi:hypothetical protein
MTMKWTSIPADSNETTLASLNGPATITGLHMKARTPDTERFQDNHTLRKTVIRIYWDNDPDPAVECPLGDFFGTGFGDKQPAPDGTPAPLTYAAVPFGMTNDFYYFRLPMPFRKSARITLENGTGSELDIGWAANITTAPVPDNAAYLHVQWRDHITREGKHVPILQTTGRGHFVGTVLSMQSPWWLSYLEGDEKIYVDGESYPSIYGTGTEDYFNCGWYYREGTVARPFHGITVKRDPQSRTSQYRMHIPDCVPFTKSIKVEIEHGESNNKPFTNYAIVAYWYQDSTSHQRQWDMPRASELRLPGVVFNDPEEPWMLFHKLAPSLDVAAGLVAGGGTTRLVPMKYFDESISGPDRLLITSDKPGAYLCWDYACPRDDLYSIEFVAVKNPSFGIGELLIDGEPTGQKIDFFHGDFVRHPYSYQSHMRIEQPVFMKAGTRWLQIRIVEKNENSTGYNMAPTAYRITGASPWPAEWNLIGSFPGGRDSGYARACPPEQDVDLAATYTGSLDNEIQWTQIKTNGPVWIHERLSPNVDCVAYAHTYVWSPDDRDIDALVSTDDAGKLFINGELVWGIPGINHLQVDRFAVPVHLVKGWNEVLIKICQTGGHWGYAFRITDPKQELIYSTTKELPPE